MVRLDLTITILLTDECFLRTDHNVLYLYYCSEYDLDDTWCIPVTSEINNNNLLINY